MIHAPNTLVMITPDALGWAVRQIPDPDKLGQAFGLAVDDAVKHRAMRMGYAIPSKYSSWDIQSGDMLVEIKSTSSTSFTFSQQEYEFMKHRVRVEEGQYKILFYKNDFIMMTSLYLGVIDAKVLFDDSLFKISNFNDNSWYVELNHVQPILT